MKNKTKLTVISIFLSIVITCSFLGGCCQTANLGETIKEKQQEIIQDEKISERLDVFYESPLSDLSKQKKLNSSVDNDSLLNEKIDEILSVDATNTSIEEKELTVEEQVADFAVFNICYDLSVQGNDVLNGYVFYQDKYVPVLLTTAYQGYILEDGSMAYSAAFLQMVMSGETPVIPSNEQILSAYSVDNDGNVTSYVIDSNVNGLQGFSGIFMDTYFSYMQTTPNSVTIEIKENKRKNYNESLMLYNFDLHKTIIDNNLSFEGLNGSIALYEEEKKSYEQAVEAVNAIIAKQEELACEGKLSTVILFTEAVLNEYLIYHQSETINDYLLDELNGIELKKGQYLMIDIDGVSIISEPDVNTLSKQRVTNGLIQAFTGAILLGTSIYFTVVTAGAGLPTVVAAIGYIASAGAILYGANELLVGSENVYFGWKKDVKTEAWNPAVNALQTIIPDEQKAKIAWNVIGLTCSIAQSLIIPLNTALTANNLKLINASRLVKFGSGIIAGGRVVLTQLVGIGLSMGVGTLTNIAVQKMFEKNGWDENAGDIVGYVSSLGTAILTGGLFHRLNKAVNLNGLYPKNQADKVYLMVAKNQKAFNAFLKESKATDFGELWAADKAQDLQALGQKYLDLLAKSAGVKAPKFEVTIRYDGNLGTNQNGKITLNSVYLNSDSIYYIQYPDMTPSRFFFETLGHEFQHHLQSLGKVPGITAYDLNEGYIPPNMDYNLYYKQPCEVDARAAGTLWADLISALMGGVK